MIQINHISFSYGSKPILQDVSITAQPGECVAILGNNGAGKSTLITCINQIRRPQSGDVVVHGKSVKKMSRSEMARSIAYVAQKNEMSHATVFDCVLLGRKPYFKWGVSQEDIKICETMLRRVDMDGFMTRNLDELSGGELQKVMLARALVQQPKVLLLDEPTSNLDPKNQYEMMALVRQIAKEQGITVFIVIHDLNLALRYCDRFFFLKNHRNFSFGGTETVTETLLEQVFGIHTKLMELDGRKFVIME